MTLDERLTNWGRVWRTGRIRHTCASLEGAYRPPRGVEVEYDCGFPPPRPWCRIDVPDAVAIEHAVCAIDVYHHALLRASYVWRLKPWDCLREARRASAWARIGLARHYPRPRIRDYADSMAMARVLLTAQLGIPAVVHRHRAVELVRRLLLTGVNPVPALD